MKVKDSIKKRRALRSLVEVDISDEIKRKLGHAAQLAPSCFNKQPWQFIFISSSEGLKSIQTAITDKNSWAYNASMFIAVVSEASLDCRMKDGREYYLFDTGIACGFIMLQATELGLIAHPMAGYNQDKAKELLGIPPEMTLINLIAIGKHTEDYETLLTEAQIEIEENRPERKSLSDFIFIDSYGNKLEKRDEQ